MVHAISLGVEAIPGVEMISAETGGTGIFAPAVSDSSNTMLQSLSDAFLSQFHNDEGQALTIVSGIWKLVFWPINIVIIYILLS